MVEKIYNKFTVIKNEDIRKYLTKEQIGQLLTISSVIQAGRMKDGKTAGNLYYVVNQDEHYADAVLQTILKGEERKSFCENIKGEKCSTRDYGSDQYKNPCYECCIGCAGAINMECNFVCIKVAEHYYPTEKD